MSIAAPEARSTQGSEPRRVGFGVDALQDQANRLGWTERASKCLDDRQRVLARQVAVHVEHEQEQELIGPPPPASPVRRDQASPSTAP